MKDGIQKVERRIREIPDIQSRYEKLTLEVNHYENRWRIYA
jgi:hypothetical protein